MADFFEKETMSHGHTYAFHPLALSAIPPAISEYKKLMATGLPEKAARHLQKKLYELADRHESIGDVRGIGHFWALELVKNRKTKELFNTKMDKFTGAPLMTAKVAQDAMQRGVFLNPWYDTLVVTPPLTITEEEIDEGIAVLDKSLEIADKEVVSTGVPASRTSEYGKK